MLQYLSDGIFSASYLQWLIILGNLAYLASYSVRDILWLRLLNCLGMLLCMYYFLMKSSPDYIVFTWHVVFCVVNGYHIVRLFRERLPVQLTEEEQSLHETTLKTLSPQQVKQMMSCAEWRSAAPEQLIVEQDVDLQELTLLHSGQVLVEVDGENVARLGAGQFVGEFSFLTNGKTSARVVAEKPVRYAVWRRSDFDELVDRNPEMHMAMHSILGIDLVQKLLVRNRPEPEVAI